jgi:alginate O-acetyltransferase complex protein AlgJ
MKRYPVKSFADFLLITLFLGVILASPLKMLLTRSFTWSEAEKRSLAPLPHIPTTIAQISAFFSDIDAYLKDHFGFREFYIYSYSRELDKYFDLANDQAQVIKGLDDWYFYNEFGMLRDFQGKMPLTRPQLQTWLTIHNERNDWLNSQGIRYMLIVPPDKQSIYPQLVMKHAMAVKGTSRFEQLLEYTGNQLPSYMLNLHQLLQPEKYDKPLYYKNDSHWNKLAAYIVFRSMFTRFSAWFPDEPFKTEFTFTADATGIGGNTGKGGDLVKMVMQPNLTETYPQLARFKRCGQFNNLRYQLSNITQAPGRLSFVHRCPDKSLRAVIFRDSFLVPMEPLLSENFREVVYLWKDYDQKNIEEIMTYFKPDIVIESVVERNMFNSMLNQEQKRQNPQGTGDE